MHTHHQDLTVVDCHVYLNLLAVSIRNKITLWHFISKYFSGPLLKSMF